MKTYKIYWYLPNGERQSVGEAKGNSKQEAIQMVINNSSLTGEGLEAIEVVK